jgi:hypothetical protein
VAESSAETSPVVEALESGEHTVDRDTFKHPDAVRWFWREVDERRGWGQTPYDVWALSRTFETKGNLFLREVQAALAEFTDYNDRGCGSVGFHADIRSYQSRQ